MLIDDTRAGGLSGIWVNADDTFSSCPYFQGILG